MRARASSLSPGSERMPVRMVTDALSGGKTRSGAIIIALIAKVSRPSEIVTPTARRLGGFLLLEMDDVVGLAGASLGHPFGISE